MLELHWILSLIIWWIVANHLPPPVLNFTKIKNQVFLSSYGLRTIIIAQLLVHSMGSIHVTIFPPTPESSTQWYLQFSIFFLVYPPNDIIFINVSHCNSFAGSTNRMVDATDKVDKNEKSRVSDSLGILEILLPWTYLHVPHRILTKGAGISNWNQSEKYRSRHGQGKHV